MSGLPASCAIYGNDLKTQISALFMYFMLVLYVLPKIAFVNLDVKSLRRENGVCSKAMGTSLPVEYLSSL